MAKRHAARASTSPSTRLVERTERIGDPPCFPLLGPSRGRDVRPTARGSITRRPFVARRLSGISVGSESPAFSVAARYEFGTGTVAVVHTAEPQEPEDEHERGRRGTTAETEGAEGPEEDVDDADPAADGNRRGCGRAQVALAVLGPPLQAATIPARLPRQVLRLYVARLNCHSRSFPWVDHNQRSGACAPGRRAYSRTMRNTPSASSATPTRRPAESGFCVSPRIPRRSMTTAVLSWPAMVAAVTPP